jgi:hypothetical protein
MTNEVLCVVTVLLSHQIEGRESIDSPNNSQHEFLDPDLLFHLLRDITSRSALFRQMMKLQSESALVPSQKSFNFIFLVSLENVQELSASFHPNLSQNGH